MSKIKEFFQKIMPSKRKLMQLYFALLLNANVQNFATGAINQDKTKIVCAPGINCYSCPGAIGACPVGSLQASFSSTNHSSIYYVVGILLLYCVLFGRMICGWVCPFGLIGELLYKIKSPKVRKSPVTRILSFFKYVVLVFFVLIVPILYGIRKVPLPAFCKYICPVGTVEGGLGLLSVKANEGLFALLGPLFTWKFLLMVSVIVGSVFIFRLFCRFLCPLGGLYGLFNKFSVFGIKVDEEKCTHCNICIAHCKCDIKHVGDQECISCGDCIDVCPTKAISWKGPKILLKANDIPADADNDVKAKHEKKRLICRITTTVILLAVLIGTVIYFWDPVPADPVEPPAVSQPEETTPTDPTEPADPTDPSNPDAPVDAEVGNKVGNKCPSVTIPILTADGQSTETIDPSALGKITIINFWGTWCGPCKAELPFFDEVASMFPDQVAVIAIHSVLGVGDGPAYIADKYPNTKMIFAVDNMCAESDFLGTNGELFLALGYKDAYPTTIILDENGVIIYTSPKAFHSTAELLAELPERLFNGVPSISTEDGSELGFQMYKDDEGNFSILPNGMTTTLLLNKVSELESGAAIDPSVLNGVYEAYDGETLWYTFTFDNGKLTIVDTEAAAEFPLAGNYQYQVPTNNIEDNGDKPEFKAALIAFGILSVLTVTGLVFSRIYFRKQK